MTRKVLIEGVVFLAIGVVGLIEGLRLTMQKEAHLTRDLLGPGRFVFIISLLIIITGAIHFISQRRKILSIKKVAMNKEMIGRVILMIAVFAIYNCLTYYVGYVVGTLVFFLLEFRILEIKTWSINAVLSFVLTAVYCIVFVYLCNVPFPKTIFF